MLQCSIHGLVRATQPGQAKDFFPTDSSMVIRRGQSFQLEILSSAISGSYDILISFVSFFNPRKTYGEYNTYGYTQNAKQLVLEVKIPSSFPIGKFSLSVKLFVREERETRLALVSPHLIVLFNPSAHEDATFLADTAMLRAYFRDDSGVIFRGSSNSREAYPWEYAQYSEECLEAAMRIISDMEPEAAADVVRVGQNLTSRVNPFNREGIFQESYSARPLASVSPAQWNSSLPPIRRFLTGKRPPLPGECWTLAGVLVSLLRCVGVPARPVTCYNAAHRCKKLGRNDRYFMHQVGLVESLNSDVTWVYHVWVEAWLSSSPQSSPGWQVRDPSSNRQTSGPFRTGPIPVQSIANYRTLPIPDHTVECVAGEMNYSCYTFKVVEVSVIANCWKYSLAKIEDQPDASKVVTIGDSYKLQDITDSYKLDFDPILKHSEDMLFETFSENHLVDLGSTLKFGIRVENKSDFSHQFEGLISVDSILYTLLRLSHIKDFHFSGSLGPRKSREFNFLLKYHEYSSHLHHQCFIRLLYEAQTVETSPTQTFLTSSYLRVKPPALTIAAPEEVKLGAQYRIKIHFRNPYPISLSHVTIHLNGYWLMREPQELKFRRAVKPDEEISVIAKLHPICLGTHSLFATLTAVEFANIYTTKIISVLRA